MKKEKQQELNATYKMLITYNLWRRGKIDEHPGNSEIGKAIDCAAEAILDFIRCDARLDFTERSLKAIESSLAKANDQLRKRDRIIALLNKNMADMQNEILRLKAILAEHHIKFSGNRLSKNKKQLKNNQTAYCNTEEAEK